MTNLHESRLGSPDAAALVDALSRNSIVGPCGTECVQTLAASATIHVASRGTVVIEAQEAFPYLGFLCDGILAVTLSGEGPIRGVRRVQLYEAHAGETFGEAAVLADAPPLGDIAVISKRATYALFPAAAIKDAAAGDATLLQRLAVQVAVRAHEIAKRMISQHGWSVTSRVARVFLPFAKETSGMQPADPQLAEFTQRDIAAAAGCVKEAAARAISELEDAGALRRARGRVRELNRDVLVKYCERDDAPAE